MKVLHILDRLNRGGAEMLVLNICKAAHLCNAEIILLDCGGGQLEKEYQQSGIQHIKISRKFPLDLIFIYKLRKFILSEKINIVHTHQYVTGVQAYLACFGLKTKLVHTHHGFGYEIDLKNKYSRKFLMSKVNANIYVSNHLKKHFIIKYKLSNVNEVIYNGIVINHKRIENNIRKELNIKDNAILMGMIGNFYSNGRDHITICKALPYVFSKYPDARFIFVGGKSVKNSHLYDDCVTYCKENSISDKVYFLGLRSDVDEILSALDIFVFTSTIDTFGIAIIEAMAKGVPTIVNDYAPFLEITENGKYGLIFKTQNHEDLSYKLLDLMENKDKRIDLGNKSQKWVSETFDIVKNIQKSEALYKKIIGVE